MSKNTYIPKNDFELHVYIDMTEICYDVANRKGYANLHSWAEHIRKYLTSDAKLNAIVRQLTGIYVLMNDKHALTAGETTSYIITYFKNRLWVEYEPLIAERMKYDAQSK